MQGKTYKSSSSLEQSGDLDVVWAQVTAMLNTCARLDKFKHALTNNYQSIVIFLLFIGSY